MFMILFYLFISIFFIQKRKSFHTFSYLCTCICQSGLSASDGCKIFVGKNNNDKSSY